MALAKYVVMITFDSSPPHFMIALYSILLSFHITLNGNGCVVAPSPQSAASPPSI
jgi:hypothetical protein